VKWLVCAALLALLGVGCMTGAGSPDSTDDEAIAVLGQALVPAKGTATTLDIASWNIEWFGDANNGPSDNDLQRENAYDVIAGSDMDIWGVAEIVSTSQFNTLKGQLPGYAGFLANDASVISGSTYYSSSEQKVGILYKSSIASLVDARIILTGSDSDFAGRPPLQVTLSVTLNGTTANVVVIVLHAKCCSDSTSWTRRNAAAAALKSYLDSSFPTQKVFVVGDFNDDLDTSITPGQPSPYASLLNDSADYAFPSLALTNAGISSTIGFPDTIDHHLNTNDANATYVAGSIEVYRVDNFISSYGSTTSDHFPVLSRYTWSGGGGGTPQLMINEICANEPGSNTVGEFVEIVNVGTGAASIGGYTVRDGSAIRHTFAAGTTLQPGKAIVVFGGAAGIPGGLTNAVAASTGDLNLANAGDTVSLRNASGTTIQTFTYSSTLASSDGVSINRSPDGSASGTFVKHNTISALARSAGTRASGSAW
jgi:endonuclease/exonuclease/phosphatase family metal-dependent hydrolase